MSCSRVPLSSFLVPSNTIASPYWETFSKMNLSAFLIFSLSVHHLKELDCQLHKIASAEEKLSVLKDYNIPKEEM